MKFLVILLLLSILAITGCTTTSVEGQQVQAVGSLDITGEYEVAPGKYTVSNWSGEALTLEFTLTNRVQERCFRVNDDHNPLFFFHLICLQPGYSEVIAWPYKGEDTSFTIKEVGQGNVQNELLCKIVGER